MSILRTCDACKMPHLDTKRYGVSRQRARVGEQGNTTYGAGGIDLCDKCWERICRPKTRPNRAHGLRAVNAQREGRMT